MSYPLPLASQFRQALLTTIFEQFLAGPEGSSKKPSKIGLDVNQLHEMKNLAHTDIHRSILIIHYQRYFKISFLIHFSQLPKPGFFDISLVTVLHFYLCRDLGTSAITGIIRFVLSWY
jgi:hypothetical protein